MKTVLAGAGLICFTSLIATTAFAQAPPPAPGAAPPAHGAAPPGPDAVAPPHGAPPPDHGAAPHAHGAPPGHDAAGHDHEEHEHPIAPPGKPQPYSLPWQLRPAIPVTVVRNDVTFGFYSDPATKEHGFAGVHSLVAMVKLEHWLALGARVTSVGNVAPSTVPVGKTQPVPGVSSGSFGNPAVWAMFHIHAHDFHIAPWLTLVIPLGMGGGDGPDVGPDTANKAGVRVRSSLDNALFAPNYFAVAPGIDLAWVRGGLTLQAEATLLQLMRVKGAAASPDAAITNLTMGFHAGYFIIPQLSLGAEIRHQRLLTTTKLVGDDEDPKVTPPDKQKGLRDTTTFAVGARGHFKIGETSWIRPGLAYSRGIDKPLSAAQYNMLQIDVPIIF